MYVVHFCYVTEQLEPLSLIHKSTRYGYLTMKVVAKVWFNITILQLHSLQRNPLYLWNLAYELSIVKISAASYLVAPT